MIYVLLVLIIIHPITNYTAILNVCRLIINMQFGVISQIPNTNTYIILHTL